MEIEEIKKRNYIFIANGMDPALKGFSLDGWEVKTIHKRPIENETPNKIGESLFAALDRAVKHPSTFMSIYKKLDFVNKDSVANKDVIHDFIKENNYEKIINPLYVFLEKNTKLTYEIYPIISALRLFKTSCLGLYYPLSYDNSGEILSETFFGYPSII